MKKIIFRALLLLSGAALGSCSEDLETDVFGISGNTILFPADGGTQTLVVDVKCDCTLSCDADWLVCSPQYVEAGKSELTITAAENPTFKARETTILLANEELNLTRTIAIRQEGIGGDRVITYTTADENPITIQESAFGATLLSHEYDAETRTGALAFDRAITTIGSSAFLNCSSLTSITIPNSVTTIGSSAFLNCSSLTSIKIPDSVTEIGDDAFSGCSSLRAFNGKFASSDKRCLIVEGVLVAFAPAELTSYSIPNSVTTIRDWAFSGCSSLTSVKIPDSVTTIGGWAFYGCTGLTNVTIGSSVTEIESGTFCECSSLTSIKIPDSVTEIGYYAFYGCSNLTSIYCKPQTPPTLDSRVFENIASSAKIYVPTQSVAAYKSASSWSKYASMIVGYDF